jgi:hypothetical protein
MIDRYFEIPIFRLANPNGKLRKQKTRHCQLASNSFLTLLMKFDEICDQAKHIAVTQLATYSSQPINQENQSKGSIGFHHPNHPHSSSSNPLDINMAPRPPAAPRSRRRSSPRR